MPYQRRDRGAHVAEYEPSEAPSWELDRCTAADPGDEDSEEDVLVANDETELESSEEDEEVTEAMIAFQTAKQRLAQAKKSSQRGFTGHRPGRGSSRESDRSVAERKAKSKCADCGGVGHWHGDPICPKVISGE